MFLQTLREVTAHLPHRPTLVIGDYLLFDRARSAQVLGGPSLEHMRPIIAFWHLLNRAVLPALLLLLGPHWTKIVRLTGHSAVNALSGAFEHAVIVAVTSVVCAANNDAVDVKTAM